MEVAYYYGFEEIDGRRYFECALNNSSTFEFIFFKKNITSNDEFMCIKEVYEEINLSSKNYAPKININEHKLVSLEFQKSIIKQVSLEKNIFVEINNKHLGINK